MEPWEVDDSLGYVGEVIDEKYVVDRTLGKGAFAIVYHATADDGTEAAIKVPLVDEEAAIFRFTREIKVMESLPDSPNLIKYRKHGRTQDGRLYLAMEYVAGPTLSDGLRSKAILAPVEAAAGVGQIALALQSMHRFGIVHRDLKPSNILIAPDGLIKLFDFGLVLDPGGMLRMFETRDILAGADIAETLERGIVVGTPEYMAIEQFEDAKKRSASQRLTCAASDVFSAGVILYRLITGEVPFPLLCVEDRPMAREIIDYLQWRSTISSVDLEPPPEVDGALWQILSRALDTEPTRRQRNGKALADELFIYLTTRRETMAFQIPLTADEPTTDRIKPTAARLSARELFGDLDLTAGSTSFEAPVDDETTLREDSVQEDTIRERQPGFDPVTELHKKT